MYEEEQSSTPIEPQSKQQHGVLRAVVDVRLVLVVVVVVANANKVLINNAFK